MKIANKSILIVFTLCACILIITSCSKDITGVVVPEEQSPDSYDRQALLTNYANAYIHQSWSRSGEIVSDFVIICFLLGCSK